ncbi:Hypothetical predicted protein [Pelobates cultripes]|uniref:Uncharacterized protein n=1 Tax=Pelobates cultripes TaxID=61616 RepID=A0AAD1RKJ0_PELCU|nr:Hypothetical predicted protein [Pelobates cultripes]
MLREQLYRKWKCGSVGGWKQRILLGGRSRQAGSNTWDRQSLTAFRRMQNGRKVKGAKVEGRREKRKPPQTREKNYPQTGGPKTEKCRKVIRENTSLQQKSRDRKIQSK